MPPFVNRPAIVHSTPAALHPLSVFSSPSPPMASAPPSPSPASASPPSSSSLSPTSISTSSAAPPTGSTLFQLVLPFLPVFAFSLLVLFLFRLLLRQCRAFLFMRLQLVSGPQRRQQQQQQPANNGLLHRRATAGLADRPNQSEAGGNGTNRRLSISPIGSPVPNHIVAPWAIDNFCETPTSLFLLQQSGTFFPNSVDAFLDPQTAAFWLDHHQLISTLGPMPPKYEDAVKMAAPPVQPLCIPSLPHLEQQQRRQSVERRERRRRQAPASELGSPPPCYEQHSRHQMIPVVQPERRADPVERQQQQQQQQQPQQQRERRQSSSIPAANGEHRRQPEHPSNFHTASADDVRHVVLNGTANYKNNANSLGPGTTIGSSTILLDRPCSSCSLGSDGLNATASRKRALTAFVPKQPHFGGGAGRDSIESDSHNLDSAGQ